MDMFSIKTFLSFNYLLYLILPFKFLILLLYLELNNTCSGQLFAVTQTPLTPLFRKLPQCS